MVIGTFLIVYKLGSLNKYSKVYQQRKADCAGTYALNLPEVKKDFLKKYKIESFNSSSRSIDSAIQAFCNFYAK